MQQTLNDSMMHTSRTTSSHFLLHLQYRCGISLVRLYPAIVNTPQCRPSPAVGGALKSPLRMSSGQGSRGFPGRTPLLSPGRYTPHSPVLSRSPISGHSLPLDNISLLRHAQCGMCRACGTASNGHDLAQCCSCHSMSSFTMFVAVLSIMLSYFFEDMPLDQ